MNQVQIQLRRPRYDPAGRARVPSPEGELGVLEIHRRF